MHGRKSSNLRLASAVIQQRQQRQQRRDIPLTIAEIRELFPGRLTGRQLERGVERTCCLPGSASKSRPRRTCDAT
jgi:hypothetical protein